MANYLAVTTASAPYVTIVDAADYSVVSGTPSTGALANWVEFDAAGTRLAAVHGGTGGLMVLDVPAWSSVGGLPTIPSSGGYVVSWSADGAYLVVGFADAPYYRVYNTSTWAVVSGLPSVSTPVKAASWSADGQYLAIAHGFGAPWTLKVISVGSWALVSGTPTITGAPRNLAWSPDSSKLAIINASGLVVYDAADWSVISAAPTVGDAQAIAWRRSGTHLGVARTSSFDEYRVSDWTLTGNIASVPGGPVWVAYRGDDAEVAFGFFSSPGVRAYATADWSALSTPTLDYGARLAFSPPAEGGPYTLELPINLTVVLPEYAQLPLQVTVTTPAYLELPIALTVFQEAYAAELPLALTVYTPSVAELPIALTVFDGAVEGGLDGAGGWAAAPDGLWRPVVVLDGVDVSDRLAGPVTVRHAANAAAIAELSILPASAMQPLALIGRSVRIAFAQAGGANAQTIFSGVVDVPSIDLQTGAIALTCHNQAQERWANTPRSVIDSMVGGRWHVAIAGDAADGFDYLSQRIATVGKSWAIDALGELRVLPWGDTTRTVTVRQADVGDLSLSLDLPSREQLRTRVVCRMQYRYTLLRARGAILQFAQPLSFYLPDSTPTQERPARLFLTTSMIEGAVGGVSGWTLTAPVAVDHPPSGAILLDGTTLDPDAVFLISAQAAQDLAVGFRARFKALWQQSITEDYTLEVVWAGLEAQIGAPISEEIGATLEAEFDIDGWGTDDSVEPVLVPPGLGDAELAWQPAGYDAAERDEVMRTLADMAYVRLHEASRSGRGRFSLPCRPDLWLDTRVTCIADGVTATGDIVEVEHVLDPSTGQAVSNVTMAIGMPGATPAAHPTWTLPAAPASGYEPPDSAYSFVCGTYVGGDATSPPFDDEAMIGFSTNTDGPEIDGRNYYPHKLTILPPALAAEDRDPLTLTASETYVVTVPTDQLEIT